MVDTSFDTDFDTKEVKRRGVVTGVVRRRRWSAAQKGRIVAEATTYAYDPQNRLMTATASGLAAAYAYDPLDRRTEKSGTGVTPTVYLDDDATEIAEYSTSGTLMRRYVPGPEIDQPIAMITPSGGGETRNYFHADKVGSVVAMSADSGGLATGPVTYDPFGASANLGTSEAYGFTGQRLDPETGLYYYRARYYSPALGRFLQVDPIGYENDLNLYTYVGNDPTDKTDPTGKDTAGIGFEGSINVPFLSGQFSFGIAFDDKGNGVRLGTLGGGVQIDPGTVKAAGALFSATSLKQAVSALKQIATSATKDVKGLAKDSVSLTGQFTKSNANTVQGLGGKFTNDTVQGGVGVGGGRTTFQGTEDGKPVSGTTYSAGLVAGVSASKTTSFTLESALPKNPNPKPPQCMHNPQAGGCQ